MTLLLDYICYFFYFFLVLFSGGFACEHRKWTLCVHDADECVVCVYLVQTNICIGGTDTRFPTGKDIKFPLARRLLSRLRLGQCVYIVYNSG